MTPQRWSRIKELFDAAVDLPAGEQEAFVRKACADNPEFASEVLRMLRASEQADDYLEQTLPLPPEAAGQMPQIGETIGHYQVLAKVGEGGMGQVFRARDPRLGRFVAIKILSGWRGNIAEGTLRLVREARAASALNHPNIVTVYDIGTLPGGDPESPFVVMEFVEGRTLQDVIKEGAAPLKTRLGYAVQIADALIAAHTAGIIHRDVKPANVMLTSQGLVKVLDFGLARHVGSDMATGQVSGMRLDNEPGSEHLTKSGFIMGTIAYASPEQVEGRALDARSDIFSFGVLLYELLSGVHPFGGSTPVQVAAAVLREQPRPLSKVCPEAGGQLEHIAEMCLKKAPAERFQHMGEVKAALERVRDLLITQSTAAPRQRPRRAMAAAMAVAGVLAAAGAYLFLNRGEPALVPLTAAPLTSYVGVEQSPTFSPDGSHIAFSWTGEDRGNVDIYARPVKDGRYLRLTEHAYVDETPAWSPDGQYIAFRRLEPGFGMRKDAKAAVILVPPLGGAERVLVEGDIRYVGWTADSREVAVSVLVSGEEMNTSRHAVELISVETGARRRLTNPPAGSRGDLGFSFSPDGKWVALMRWAASPATDVLVMPFGGGPERPLFRENGVWTNWVVWHPDSRQLILSSSPDGRRRLWRLDSRTASKPEPLAGIEPDAAAPAVFHGSPQAAAALAFERHSDDVNIWRVDTRTGKEERVIDSTWRESSPAISPDGKNLTFASTRSGVGEIWASGADGRNQIQLSRLTAHAGTPRWSPDGGRIVFDAFVGDNKEMFVVDASGQNLKRLTNHPKEEARGSWTPDGKWIYFRSTRSGSAQIWRAPSAGGEPVQVTRNGGAEPRVSLDGKWIFYIRDRRAPELWRTPAGGGEEVKLLDGPFYGYWDVSRDGIYYLDQLARIDGSRLVRFYDFRTAKVSPVATVTRNISPSLPGLSVSADGRALYLLQVDRVEADLYLVKDFR